MLLRLSDIVVGIIAGAVCSVLAAGFEAGIVLQRYFSIGHLGSGWITKLLFVALFGAIAGGFVGLAAGGLFNRPQRSSQVS